MAIPDIDNYERMNLANGARVGMRLDDGTVVTMEMIRKQPLFNMTTFPREFAPAAIREAKKRMNAHADKIDDATAQLERANAAFMAATRANSEAARVAAETLKSRASALKDHAERLNQAMAKFSSSINSEKLATDVANVERLVGAIERLSALSESGVLDRVMKAMSSGQ